MAARAKSVKEKSILTGVDTLIDDALGLREKGAVPRHRNPGSYKRLKRMDGAAMCALIEAILDRIQENWEEAAHHRPSTQNWRFEKKVGMSHLNKSEEVRCERAMVSLPEAVWPDSECWVNQVPVASGFTGSRADKKRCIDLVHKCDAHTYEFIELKIDANTALYAAMEILKYGILYVFYRQDDDRVARYRHVHTNENLLAANKIHLRVLAPATYYCMHDKRRDLTWLERSMNQGLSALLKGHQFAFAMDFKFETLSICLHRSAVTWDSPA